MNIKDDDRVSAVALAAESDDDIDIPATSNDPNADQIVIDSTEVDPSVNGASEDGAIADEDDSDEVDE
jgi:hypothetical protein